MLHSVPLIPVVEAQVPNKAKESGTSVPLSMTCALRTENGEISRTEYIVKFYADNPWKQRGLAREVVAALLGQVLGLNIPPISTVIVSEELCKALHGSQWEAKICNSLGLNFGSHLVTNPADFQYITATLRQAAAEVFAFDMLIQNLDRTKLKPNLFQTDDGFILIDHEKSFICAEPETLLGIIPEPWDFKTLNPSNHLCYNALKGQSVSFDEFVGNLALVNDITIDEILAQVPREWVSAEIGHIRNHLIKASQHVEQFKRSLQEVLTDE